MNPNANREARWATLRRLAGGHEFGLPFAAAQAAAQRCAAEAANGGVARLAAEAALDRKPVNVRSIPDPTAGETVALPIRRNGVAGLVRLIREAFGQLAHGAAQQGLRAVDRHSLERAFIARRARTNPGQDVDGADDACVDRMD